MKLCGAVLQLGKWDHIPVVNSTLLTRIYLSYTAWTLTVGAAMYNWSGISSLWLCLSNVMAHICTQRLCTATSGIFTEVCIENSHPMYKPFGYQRFIAKKLHSSPLYALQFLYCRTEDAGKRLTFSDDFPGAIGYKMLLLKFSGSKENSYCTFFFS